MRHFDRYERRLMRRFEPSPEAQITDALGKMLAAIELGEVTTTATAALRRHCKDLRKAGGTVAIRAALNTVCAPRPERAAERRATITAAWAVLLEMKP